MDVPCFTAYFMNIFFGGGTIICFHNATELEYCFVVMFLAIKVY